MNPSFSPFSTQLLITFHYLENVVCKLISNKGEEIFLFQIRVENLNIKEKRNDCINYSDPTTDRKLGKGKEFTEMDVLPGGEGILSFPKNSLETWQRKGDEQ